MPKYRAGARVLGLAVGEEFESEDTEFYDPFVKTEYLTIVSDDADEDGEPSEEPVAGPESDEKPAADPKPARTRAKAGEGKQKP